MSSLLDLAILLMVMALSTAFVYERGIVWWWSLMLGPGLGLLLYFCGGWLLMTYHTRVKKTQTPPT